MRKRVTVKNLPAVLDNLKAWALAQDKDGQRLVCDDLNRWLDDLASQDAFGTEGQCDPRGDQRD